MTTRQSFHRRALLYLWLRSMPEEYRELLKSTLWKRGSTATKMRISFRHARQRRGLREATQKKICKQKSFHSLGFHSVIMPQNYVTHSDILTESENDKIIEDAMPKIREIAKTINAGIPLPKEEPGKSLMSKVLNPIMYATMISAKGFYTTDDCDHCGQCVKRCPLNNITMENEKPQWGKDCTHCMACIDGCPKKSIENGKATLGRNRYYNTKTPQL